MTSTTDHTLLSLVPFATEFLALKASAIAVALVLVGACTGEVVTDDGPGHVTVDLGAGHFIQFAADLSTGYETVIETSPSYVVPVLDGYGATSAAALFQAVAPNADVPSFLRRDEPFGPHGVVGSQQALTADEFVDGGGCSLAECKRQTESNFDVLSEDCQLNQLGGAQAKGTAQKAYARFNAQSTQGIAVITLPGGKVQTTIVQPEGHLRARASGSRPGQVGFEIQGEQGAGYDLYACFTAPHVVPVDSPTSP